MKLTSEMVKAKAAELGIDCIAIGNIERFRGAPKLMSPLTYFPEARSVIAVAMRIPRGTYRGIEEGTHWHNYTFYSYNKLLHRGPRLGGRRPLSGRTRGQRHHARAGRGG